MKRVLRRFALVVLTVIAFVLLLTVGAWFFLHTGPGERFARQRVVDSLHQVLPGNVDIGRLTLSGNTIVLLNVALYDPEGIRVAWIPRLEVTFSVFNLVQANVDLSKMRIEQPELHLVLDERGLNLVRALQKERPTPTEPGEPSTALVHVRDLQIDGATVDFEQSTLPDLAPRARVEALSVRGSFDLVGAEQRIAGHLELGGTVTSPVKGPLSLRADLHQLKETLDASSTLELAGAALDAKAHLDGTERARVDLGKLAAPEKTVKAFFPAWPLVAPLALNGSVDRRGNLATLDLHASAAGARVDVGGGVDVAKLRAEGLTVDASGVDFSKLVEKGPTSDVTLTLRATGGGTSLKTLQGTLSLSVPKAGLEGQTLGPIALEASADEGRFEIAKLRAQLPGASLTAHGSGTLEHVSVTGGLEATDLGLLGRTVGRILRPEGLPLSGTGALRFAVKGPPEHPGVSVDGTFASLQYESYQASGLSLTATVPDVLQPLDANADLRARALRIGERLFRDVRTQLVNRGRALTADVSAQGFADVSLHLEGTRDEGGEGLALSEMELRYPEAIWKLQRPSHVSWGPKGTQVDELVLESGRQRITVDGGVRGVGLDFRALVENLDLQKLPKAAIPGDLGLGGQVDAKIAAAGTTSHPSVTAQVRVRDGRVKTFEDVDVELDARWAKDRASGEVKMLALNSGVMGHFDVPTVGLLEGADRPVAIDLAVQKTRLEALFAALKVQTGLRGDAAATIHVEGSAKDPRVRIAVDSDHLQQVSGPPADLDLVVESTKDGPLVARIDLDTMGSHSYLLLTTPWRAVRFIRGPVTGEMFLTEPVHLEGAFREVPLEALAAWGVVHAGLQGKASLTLEAEGAVRSPTGKVHLAIRGATDGRIKPFDAFATVTAEERKVAFTLTALRGQTRMADLGASFAEGLGGLIAGSDPEKVQLEVEGDLGPVMLSELRSLTRTAPPDPEAREPEGVITATVRAGGTLADPRAELALFADKLGVGSLALGKVELRYRYADAHSTAKVLLTSSKGGELALDASTALDLSAPAVRHGLAWRDAPLQATLKAQDFDPSFLSNVSEMVRELGGRLDADATAHGTLAAPQVRGRLEWKDGRLALMGYGQYRNIHLAFEGTNDAITLKDLSAHSGGGSLQLSARGDRKGTQYSVTGQGEFTHFPIIVDDQLRALLSGRMTLEGDASKELVFIRNLTIPEAHIELPEVRTKNLQDLDRRDDIILVRRGEPLYARRKKQQPAAAGGGAEAGEPGATPSSQGTRYAVLVNAPRNIWVRGTDVNAEIGLSDGFRIEYQDSAMLFGEVRFIRGRVDVLGRRFDVLKDSQVRFAGPVKLPYINITAEHGNERENVTVYTTIRGQGSDVTIKVSSTPALSESEIYTLLATGRRTLKRGSGSSMTGAEAASVVGAYAASQVKKVLATKVPLDVLSIEAGAEGLADATLEAGTYVTDKIYVGSIYRLGADPEKYENAAGFRLEYQITPRWSFETEYGTARSGGADLIWSRDY
ncbi:MAG: translocation/assembly module TamB domain-containing protein [Myxococcaceae bacterium]|nr:translocation/assembly module TamB domain-containing protein [Myxococcaceae bacterium]